MRMVLKHQNEKGAENSEFEFDEWIAQQMDIDEERTELMDEVDSFVNFLDNTTTIAC